MIFFTYDFGGEEPDSTLITRAKFQKEHGRKGIWHRERVILSREKNVRSGVKEFTTGM